MFQREYKTFMIRVGDYGDKGLNLYYEIYDYSNKLIKSTLWNDDKMWTTITSALEAAQRDIDKILNNN